MRERGGNEPLYLDENEGTNQNGDDLNYRFDLKIQLKKSVSACKIKVYASSSNLRIRTSEYSYCYYTAYAIDELIIQNYETFDYIIIDYDEVSYDGNYTRIRLREIEITEETRPTYNTPIQFNYDNAGNMVLREIILSSSGQKSGEIITEDSDIEEFTNQIGDKTINIYPNPTKGQLKVDIENTDVENNIKCKVYSLSGNVVYTGNYESNLINLEHHKKGIYFLEVTIDGQAKVWRIIKE